MIRPFSEDLGLKVIALVTSVMLYVYVGVERNPTVTRSLRAEIVRANAPDDELVVNLRPENLTVDVTGPRNEVESLEDGSIKALADLHSATLETQQCRIIGFRNPPGAAHVSVKTNKLFVGAEVVRKSRRRLPVMVSYDNRAPLGKRLVGPRVTPQFVDALGTDDALAKVDRLVAYVDNTAGAVRTVAAVRALDSSGVMVEGVRTDPVNVRVEIDLADAPASRSVLVNVRFAGQPAPPNVLSSVQPEPATITVTGRADLVQSLTSVPTVVVPLDGLKQDTTVSAPLELPAGVSVEGGAASVRVHITLKDSLKGP
jgi:YbbR domain-containing protein